MPAAIASQMPTAKRRNHRKARKPFDGRYVIGKRVKQLVDVFRTRIGPDADDPITATAIRRAAETVALSEDASSRALRADPKVTLDDVVRLTRLAELSVRRLRLDHRHNGGAP
jgi:hypothetical protein